MSEMSSSSPARIRPVRPGAFLIEFDTLDEVMAASMGLAEQPIDEIKEMVPGARTLLVRHDPHETNPEQLLREILARSRAADSGAPGTVVEIPVVYDGEDLGDVAEILGCSVDDVIRRHTETLFSVAFTGFAPGFAYLASKESTLHVPRRSSPRTVVPQGSVALAGEFTGIYPKASPGGWRLIGRTDVAMFDINREPAALLRPGMSVRFRRVENFDAKRPAQPVQKATTAPASSQWIEVVSSPLPVMAQDLGRPGLAPQGISLSGASDRSSLIAANRIVGNDRDAAALEIPPAPFTFRVKGNLVAAVTGAAEGILVRDADGDAVRLAPWTPLALNDGDTVTIEAPRRGVRSYLAIRGGFDIKPVLGSSSTDTLAQLGPAPLQVGDQVFVPERDTKIAVQPSAEPPFAMPATGETVELDVYLGPRNDWFTDEAVKFFLTQEWTVGQQSNRVGMRLAGEPLERKLRDELPSEATLSGAIQVPANGQPVLFLTDHPVTGGYPVIATLREEQLSYASQIPAGARIRFHAIETTRKGGRP